MENLDQNMDGQGTNVSQKLINNLKITHHNSLGFKSITLSADSMHLYMRMWTDWRFSLMAGFGTSGVEISGYTTKELLLTDAISTGDMMKCGMHV